MTLEVNGLKGALAGDPDISTGVTASKPLSTRLTVVKWALRDTLMAAFSSAFAAKNPQADAHPYDPALHEAGHCLCRLALMTTAEHVA